MWLASSKYCKLLKYVHHYTSSSMIPIDKHRLD